MKKYWEQIKELYGKRDLAYASLFWLFSQAGPYTKQLLVKLGISTFTLAMGFAGTIVSKYIIDATTSGSLNWTYVTYMILAAVFTILFSAVADIFDSYISEKFEFGMRCDMFNQIQTGVWNELSKYHSGDIVTRLTTDISTISSGLISIIPSAIIMGLRLLISFCILFYFDRWLAIFALFVAPIGAICALLYRKKYSYYYNKLRDTESSYRTFMQESLSNIAVIKTFQLEADNMNYMKNIRSERMSLVMSSSRLSALMSAFISLVYRTAYVVAFCWSAYRISTGQITYGTMTVFLSLVSQVQGSISSLGSTIPELYRMLISARRITDIVDIQNEDYKDITSVPEQVSVEIKDMTFSYDRKKNILEHLSLTVKPGDIVGIVGHSGAGKTTLIRLLLSLLKPDEGSVEYIDENGNRENAQPASRRFISYVPQGNTLLSGIVLELFPLSRELELHILVESDVVLQLFRPCFYSRRLVVADIGLPAARTGSRVRFFDRHEEGVVGQPEFVLFFERGKFLRVLVAASLVSYPQKAQAPLILLAVVHLHAIAEVHRVALFLREQALRDQVLKADQIRISRKGRERLIGRIPVSRRTKGQDLPVGLPRFLQKIHKLICLLRKAADPVLAGQAEYRKQNSACTHNSSLSKTHSCFSSVSSSSSTQGLSSSSLFPIIFSKTGMYSSAQR